MGKNVTAEDVGFEIDDIAGIERAERRLTPRERDERDGDGLAVECSNRERHAVDGDGPVANDVRSQIFGDGNDKLFTTASTEPIPSQ